MTPNEEAAMRLQIRRYVAGLTRRIAELATENTDADCLDCRMIVQPNNVSMGDWFKSHEHLIAHMERWSYPGSMLTNAWQEYIGDTTTHPVAIEEVRGALQLYLESRLLSSESRLLA